MGKVAHQPVVPIDARDVQTIRSAVVLPRDHDARTGLDALRRRDPVREVDRTLTLEQGDLEALLVPADDRRNEQTPASVAGGQDHGLAVVDRQGDVLDLADRNRSLAPAGHHTGLEEVVEILGVNRVDDVAADSGGNDDVAADDSEGLRLVVVGRFDLNERTCNRVLLRTQNTLARTREQENRRGRRAKKLAGLVVEDHIDEALDRRGTLLVGLEAVVERRNHDSTLENRDEGGEVETRDEQMARLDIGDDRVERGERDRVLRALAEDDDRVLPVIADAEADDGRGLHTLLDVLLDHARDLARGSDQALQLDQPPLSTDLDIPFLNRHEHFSLFCHTLPLLSGPSVRLRQMRRVLCQKQKKVSIGVG